MKRSILLDSQADLISYGMGEHSIVEIADALDSGIEVKDITFIDGTVYKTRNLEQVYDYELLPDYTRLCQDKKEYAKSFFVQYSNTDPFTGKRLVEPYDGKEFVVQNPPAKPPVSYTHQEMIQMISLVGRNSLLCYMVDASKFKHIAEMKKIVSGFAEKIDFINMIYKRII